MNFLTEQPTATESVMQTSTTAILTSVFYQVLADSVVWLVVAATLIVCDLYFGIEAARRRAERVRFSRASRRTINKACEYLCWVMLGITISIGFSADWLKYAIFGIVYGIELSSCFTNYFSAKGKRFTFDILRFIGKRIGVDELTDACIENEQADSNTKQL